MSIITLSGVVTLLMSIRQYPLSGCATPGQGWWINRGRRDTEYHVLAMVIGDKWNFAIAIGDRWNPKKNIFRNCILAILASFPF